MALSIAIAALVKSVPVYLIPISSKVDWTFPSSPPTPWSAINTTSASWQSFITFGPKKFLSPSGRIAFIFEISGLISLIPDT